MAETPTRKLVVIVHADVVGSTALTRLNETVAHQRIQDAFRRFSATVAEYRGITHEIRGDALVAEFARASDAVSASLAFQIANVAGNERLSDDIRPSVRVGIAMGEVVIADNTITGDGVVLAQRLEHLAEPGGVCIQAAARETVPQRLPFSYDDLGEQKLKGFEAAVRVYAVTLTPGVVIPAPEPREKPKWRGISLGAIGLLAMTGAGLFWLQPWGPEEERASIEPMAIPPPDKPSIAVLPFANMSDDPRQEYFTDGMSEDLITDLSKVSGLTVIARNSTFAYKGQSPDVREVARDLGVRYVLEGSVRKAGNAVRINAQLINAADGSHLWADRYDGRLDDVFALQDKVTAKIVSILAVQLTTGEQEQISKKETTNLEAYDEFLKGWAQHQLRSPEGFRLAIEHFKKAIALDPGYSRVHAALSATYWEVYNRFWHNAIGMQSVHDPMHMAQAMLEKALKDPTPLALQVSSRLNSLEGFHKEALADAERAIALDPNDADGLVALASVSTLAGEPEKAVGLIHEAMRLNPHFPSSYLYELGLAQFGLSQYSEAARTLERASALSPEDTWPARILVAAYGHLDRKEDVERVMNTAKRSWFGFNALTIKSVAFWYKFKRSEDAERLAVGLRKAGVPD